MSSQFQYYKHYYKFSLPKETYFSKIYLAASDPKKYDVMGKPKMGELTNKLQMVAKSTQNLTRAVFTTLNMIDNSARYIQVHFNCFLEECRYEN